MGIKTKPKSRVNGNVPGGKKKTWSGGGGGVLAFLVLIREGR